MPQLHEWLIQYPEINMASLLANEYVFYTYLSGSVVAAILLARWLLK